MPIMPPFPPFPLRPPLAPWQKRLEAAYAHLVQARSTDDYLAADLAQEAVDALLDAHNKEREHADSLL
jgi:hypothetical protein